MRKGNLKTKQVLLGKSRRTPPRHRDKARAAGGISAGGLQSAGWLEGHDSLLHELGYRRIDHGLDHSASTN
jgi:hypothetical protein